MKKIDWITISLLLLSILSFCINADALDVSIYTASSLDNTLIEFTTSCKSTHKLLVKTSELDDKQKQILKWGQDMEDRCFLPINHKIDATMARLE